jgi:hypothetical protein
MKSLAIVLALAACGRERIDSCDADLGGVWVTPAGARWMMLDNRATLEAYPMAPDAGGSTAEPSARPTAERDIVVAPRVLDLTRGPGNLAGEQHRRYMRRADVCDARSAVHVTGCHDDTIELVTSDLPTPLAFAPCRWPAPAPSHVEHWRHE